MRYLLDTSIVSALMRETDGALAGRIRELGESSVYTSVVVAGELRYGARRKGSERLSREVEAILSLIAAEPLQEEADRAYAVIRAALEASGRTIGPNDLWIAAHALADEATLVTDNDREFGRVPGLKVENWLRPRTTGGVETESGRDDG